MTTAIVFMLFNFLCFVLSLIKGPYWGIIAYANIYFNSPRPYINWWAEYLPFYNWSFISTVVIIFSAFLHRKELSNHKPGSSLWVFIFLGLSFFITKFGAVFPEIASYHTRLLLSYSIIVFFIIKSFKNYNQYRCFSLFVILMTVNLSVQAFFYGKRIHARLENIGTIDTFASNEFGLLLAAVIPLTLPFIMNGKRYERVICLCSMPFLVNALILCNSRGAFVALGGAIVFITILYNEKESRKTMIIAGILLIPLLLYLSDDYFIERIKTLVNTEKAISDDSLARNLSSGRTEIWMYGFAMVTDFPVGAGPGAFSQLARNYMPTEVLTFHPGIEFGVRSAHNSYLQVLVEQGFLGFIIFVMLCIHTFFLLFRSFFLMKKMKLDNQFWKYNIFALSISYLSTLIGCMFNSRIYYEFFWWQIAFSVVASSFISQLVKDKKANESLPMEVEHNLKF